MIDIYMLSVDQLIPHPDNPRKNLGDLEELTESIRANGIRQNLTVVPAEQVEDVTIPAGDDPYYVVIIGHRRLAAAKQAGLHAVPCAVESMDRKEQLSTMLMENMQRSDLTVYEQAQGFQQLHLLGCGVEEIAEKSGFSQTTVRRRLKMAELDPEILKDVTSSRQISLGDFDRLAEIEDVDLRNKALADIGTGNFGWKLERMKHEALARTRLPAVLEWLKAHCAQEIDQAEANGRKYDNLRGNNGEYCAYMYLDLAEAPRLPSDKAVKGINIFYVVKNTSVSLYMHAKNVDAGTGKKSREVLDREKLARETKKRIREIVAVHYELRKQFVEKLHVTKAIKERVLLGAVYIALYHGACSSQGCIKSVAEALGVQTYEYKTAPIIQGIGRLTEPGREDKLAKAIYALYNDGPENTFATNMEVAGQLPRFDNGNHNTTLKILYEWLISLGYECSDEETQMLDGSHEMYHQGESKG